MTRSDSVRFTKECIRSALFKLMESKSYADISMTEVATTAGVGRATLYRYYGCKTDIIRDYFAHQSADFDDIARKPINTKTDFRLTIRRVLESLKNQRQFMKLIIDAKLQLLYLDYLNEAMVGHFEANGFAEREYMPYYFAGSLFNISMLWLKNDCDVSPEQLTDLYIRMLFPKLSNDAGAGRDFEVRFKL